MNFLYPHRFWMAALGLAVVLIFANAPLLGFLREEAAEHLADLRTARTATEQTLSRLETDIAETERLSGEIGAAEVEKSLAPVDRLRAADMLERLAAAARLNHFAYTLSPEQKITVNHSATGAQELSVSTITVKADVPLDTDVYAFVERLRSAFPGRVRPQGITLERIGVEGTPPATDNLHLTASFEWLSNGVAKQVAEGR